MTQRCRSFTVTDFILDFGFWQEFYEKNKLDYLICGAETCPETKKQHYQMYIHFVNQRTLNSVIKKLKPRHVEIARGTPEQNYKYCSKEKCFVEMGKLPKAGERTDLAQILELVKEGVPEQTLAEVDPQRWCQYGRRFERYRQLIEPKRKWVTEVIIYWGEAGTGKTRKVVEMCNDEHAEVMFSGDNSCPFVSGYDGEDDVLFDDFDPASVKIQAMLKMCDRYKCTVNVKGGSRNWKPKRIFITSNANPEAWYASNPAWLRRISVVEHFSNLAKNDSEVLSGNTKLRADTAAELPSFADAQSDSLALA